MVNPLGGVAASWKRVLGSLDTDSTKRSAETRKACQRAGKGAAKAYANADKAVQRPTAKTNSLVYKAETLSAEYQRLCSDSLAEQREYARSIDLEQTKRFNLLARGINLVGKKSAELIPASAELRQFYDIELDVPAAPTSTDTAVRAMAGLGVSSARSSFSGRSTRSSFSGPARTVSYEATLQFDSPDVGPPLSSPPRPVLRQGHEGQGWFFGGDMGELLPGACRFTFEALVRPSGA